MFKKFRSRCGAVEVALLVLWGLMFIGASYSLMPKPRADYQFKKAVSICVGEAVGIREVKDEDGKVISSLIDEVNNRMNEVKAAEQGIKDACFVEVSEMSKKERLEYIKEI